MAEMTACSNAKAWNPGEVIVIFSIHSKKAEEAVTIFINL
jgi:hypothetical protein